MENADLAIEIERFIKAVGNESELNEDDTIATLLSKLYEYEEEL